MAYEIDGLDRKILAELDINSRQPITTLSKKVRRNRNVVEYRMKKLQEEGIIKNYVTLLDAGKLGLTVWNVYLEFQNLSSEAENRIIKYLQNNKKIWWVAQLAGKWNMVYSFFVRDVKELYEVVNSFNAEFGKYILQQEMVAHVQAEVFSRSYFINQPSHGVSWNKEIKQEKLNEIDISILKELATNARISSVELANKLKLTDRIVIYRIKDLMKRGIICRFRLQLDAPKIGYNFYKVIVHLKSFSKEQNSSLKEYCRTLGNIFHYINKIGPWMLELELEETTYEKTNELMKKMKEKYLDYIKSYDIILITGEPKGEMDLTTQL